MYGLYPHLLAQSPLSLYDHVTADLRNFHHVLFHLRQNLAGSLKVVQRKVPAGILEITLLRHKILLQDNILQPFSHKELGIKNLVLRVKADAPVLSPHIQPVAVLSLYDLHRFPEQVLPDSHSLHLDPGIPVDL